MISAARPRLAPDAVFHPVENEGVLLVTETEGILSLKGSLWPRLLPILDGTRTVGQLATLTLRSPGDVFELFTARFFCSKAEVLIEEGPAPADPARLFLEGAGRPSGQGSHREQRRRRGFVSSLNRS